MEVEQNWLQDYLEFAVEGRLCTRIHCTTCGALDFRTGLRKAIADAKGRPVTLELDLESAQVLARAMSAIRPIGATERFEDAVRVMLYELWQELGDEVFQAEVATKLNDSWAGDVLNGMRERYERQKRISLQRLAYNSPEAVAARQERKQRLKEVQIAARLKRKQERDRIWRDTHR